MFTKLTLAPGKDPSTVRFMYDGARVQPEDTPQTLGMDDGDAIDVVIEVRAGMQLADLARSRNGHQLIRRSKSAGGGLYRVDEPARGAGAPLLPPVAC